MADTPKDGETANQETLSNEPSDSGTPAQQAPVKTDEGEVERLRKEAEQAKLRERQLANKIKAIEDAETARRAKELEEQNEFKTLYEQEKAKREEAEQEREAEAKKAALQEEADKLFADYPDKVKSLAEDVGLKLTDTDEASINTFKEKLDKIKAEVGGQEVTPNNPKPQGKSAPSLGNEEGIIEEPISGEKFDEIIKSRPGFQSLLTPDSK